MELLEGNIYLDLYKVGVVVGRFQVAELTEGHKALINQALSENNDVIIFLGSEQKDALSKRNPLPFEVRKNMILSEFKDFEYKISIYPLEDKHFFPLWVANLDSMIISLGEAIRPTNFNPMGEDTIISKNVYTLYGGRDSFLKGYIKYTYSTFEFKKIDFGINSVSGTQQRKEIVEEYIKKRNNNEPFSYEFITGMNYLKDSNNEIINSVNFRKGLITFVNLMDKD